MKLVVGLGNPGRKYARTRHNLGFLIVDQIGRQNQVTLKRELCDALVGEWRNDAQRALLAKPQAYMNRSGESVKYLLDHFQLALDDLVVVHDDLDLAFGRIRIRPGGGAGGHRGVLSIMESLAGSQFYRVRVGIGRPPDGIDPTDFVLAPFTPEELEQLDTLVSRAAEAVVTLLCEGGKRAMEQFNRPVSL